MPRGDGTGPTGAGPMTGRRAGYCASNDMPGFAKPAARPGLGLGLQGGGHGWRHWFFATGLPGWMRTNRTPATLQQEHDSLQTQADWLKRTLDAINKRIEALGKS